MDGTQAQRLWLGTLALTDLPRLTGARPPHELLGLWEAAGLDGEARERLAAALAADESLTRRQRLVRETRRLLRLAGYDPDLVTTPAAEGMRLQSDPSRRVVPR